MNVKSKPGVWDGPTVTGTVNESLWSCQSVTESGGMVLGPLSPRRIPPLDALPEAPAFSAFFLTEHRLSYLKLNGNFTCPQRKGSTALDGLAPMASGELLLKCKVSYDERRFILKGSKGCPPLQLWIMLWENSILMDMEMGWESEWQQND